MIIIIIAKKRADFLRETKWDQVLSKQKKSNIRFDGKIEKNWKPEEKKTKKCILNIFKILTKTMTVRRVCLFY